MTSTPKARATLGRQASPLTPDASLSLESISTRDLSPPSTIEARLLEAGPAIVPATSQTTTTVQQPNVDKAFLTTFRELMDRIATSVTIVHKVVHKEDKSRGKESQNPTELMKELQPVGDSSIPPFC